MTDLKMFDENDFEGESESIDINFLHIFDKVTASKAKYCVGQAIKNGDPITFRILSDSISDYYTDRLLQYDIENESSFNDEALGNTLHYRNDALPVFKQEKKYLIDNIAAYSEGSKEHAAMQALVFSNLEKVLEKEGISVDLESGEGQRRAA